MAWLHYSALSKASSIIDEWSKCLWADIYANGGLLGRPLCIVTNEPLFRIHSFYPAVVLFSTYVRHMETHIREILPHNIAWAGRQRALAMLHSWKSPQKCFRGTSKFRFFDREGTNGSTGAKRKESDKLKNLKQCYIMKTVALCLGKIWRDSTRRRQHIWQ